MPRRSSRPTWIPSGMELDFNLYRSRAGGRVYHPRFVGTLNEAIQEARVRCGEDRASVTVVYNPCHGPSAFSRSVARIPWSRKTGRCGDLVFTRPTFPRTMPPGCDDFDFPWEGGR